MRTLLLAALMATLVSCYGCPNPREGVGMVDAENVWLLCGSGACGTAFPIQCRPIGDGTYEVLFLTAGHVIHFGGGETAFWTATNPDREEFLDGKIVSVHPEKDAALVKFLSPRRIEIFVLRETPPKIGEPAWTLGYPLARGLSVTGGFFGQGDHVSTPIYYGVSGGPVIDCKGRVVGIVSSVYCSMPGNPVPHLARYLPVLDVFDWIQENRL